MTVLPLSTSVQLNMTKIIFTFFYSFLGPKLIDPSKLKDLIREAVLDQDFDLGNGWLDRKIDEAIQKSTVKEVKN